MYELLKSEMRKDLSVNAQHMRNKGIIPGVLYGKGMDSIPLKVAEKELLRTLSHGAHIIEVELESEKHLVNIEEVQREPVSNKLIHVAFHKLRRDQKTTVTIPIVFTGTPVGAKQGGIVIHQLSEVDVTGFPDKICEHITVDVSNLDLHDNIHLKDITPPEGLEFNDEDLEKMVATCVQPKVEAEPVAAAATDAEGAEAAPAEGSEEGEAKAEEAADAGAKAKKPAKDE